MNKPIHPVQPDSQFGVLLVNLGTPAEPTTLAIARYLREFLSDPRVIDVNPFLWWFILNGIIIPLRSKRVACNYRKIWLSEGSPLLVNSLRQKEKLQALINQQGVNSPIIELGMTYGQPSIASGMQRLREQGVRKILILPLFPQYSATTTAAVFDAVSREMAKLSWMPELRFVNHYADEPLYIEALVNSIQRHWAQHQRGDILLISFHGLPERYFQKGDPYYCYCHKTARLIAEKLGLSDEQWRLVFQSRFGREPWLQPYCDKTLQELPLTGKKNVDIICPGFSADCLETLEEISMTNQEIFTKAGGENYKYIPALNDQPLHIQAFLELINKHGWGSISG
ncbi:MAG: ferrochelatase [Gammaproteobacteria bacterium]|nr:ferrochelatase [Gammaproteobacteria bacterium]